MTLIHILDSQTDQILDDIPHKYVPFNVHRQSLKDYQETFEFEALAGESFSQHLAKRNRIIIPGEFGELREFIIFEATENRITRNIEVYSWASYLEDLQKAKVIKAHKTDPETAQQHVNIALDGTEWTPGNITYAGIRTITFENNTNPFGYLKRVAREFELELDFRVEFENGKIVRYVDLVERLGEYRGREVVFGKDLLSLTRKENTADIVTALWVYGPEREDGTRLEVFIEDEEALQRWGRNGRHLVGEYEPQSTDENMTIERLTQLGRAELDKRINAVVEYEGGIADLENVPGLEHEQIRFADTIRIKDESYSPALYLEARIHTQERDIFVKSNKKVELGDYVEYTEEEVKAIWKQLQQQIQQKISAVQAEQMIEEYAEPKKVESPTPPPIDYEGDNPIWVDTSKDPHVPHIVEQGQWVKVVPTEAEEVNAYNKSEIDTITSDLEDGIQQAMATADGKNTVFRQSNTPPTTNRKIGDLWFKTDEGNRMFVWTGEWTETKLDYQALSVGKLSAISADLGNVTAGHIEGVTMNLAGGKVIVDEQGNATFKGHLEGATGTFSGDIQSSQIIVTGDEHDFSGFLFNWHGEKFIKLTTPDTQNFELGIFGLEQDGTRSSTPFTLWVDGEVSTNSINTEEITGEIHHSLNLLNNWTNYGSGTQPARAIKYPTGQVVLEGMIGGGLVGEYTVAVLPVGMRPNAAISFKTDCSNNGKAAVWVYSNGNIRILSSDSNARVSLSGISFHAMN